jgi:Mn-containing catalase
VFLHRQELQFKATPDKPDAVYARKLQEVLGGQYGEISVAMQYMFQGWNMHMPGKYRDLVFGIGSEEIGHVEMLAVMIAQLLEKAPLGVTKDALQDDPTVAAVIGGMDVQHAIVAGAGARPVDSNGNPWQGSYITCSGNLLADFTANANAEMQGRIQAARLFHMTDDSGVRDLLRFLIARDTMHQNQWLAAIGQPPRGAGRAVRRSTARASSATTTARRRPRRCLGRRTPTAGSTAPPSCPTRSRRWPARCRTCSTASRRRLVWRSPEPASNNCLAPD